MTESRKISAICRSFVNPNIFLRTAIREKIIRNVGVQSHPVQNQAFSDGRAHHKKTFYIPKQMFSMQPRIVLGFPQKKHGGGKIIAIWRSLLKSSEPYCRHRRRD